MQSKDLLREGSVHQMAKGRGGTDEVGFPPPPKCSFYSKKAVEGTAPVDAMTNGCH